MAAVADKKSEMSEKQNPENDNVNESIQLIVFRQGSEEYALQIDQIKEVVITPNITKMPQTPAFVKGVANIRGNVIAIMNLEEKFGLVNDNAAESDATKNFTLVIESDEYKIGLLVKEVPNTLAVKRQEIEESVNIIHDASMQQNYISGIVKKGDRLIILIDILKIVDESELTMVKQVTN